MEKTTYKCLGQHSSIILDYTEQQAEDCPKYQRETGLCMNGGVCTVMFRADKSNHGAKKALENIF